MSRFWPKSLTGQLIFIVAAALFLAQSINFALLYRASERLNIGQASGFAIARIAGFIDRMDNDGPMFERGPPPPPPREFEGRGEGREPRRMRGRRGPPRGPRPVLTETSIITGDMILREDVVLRAERALNRLDIEFESISAATNRSIPEAFPKRRGRFRASDIMEHEEQAQPRYLIVSVKLTDGQWVSVNSKVPQRNRTALFWLIGQTLILYLVVLTPIIWLSRKISRPLRDLKDAVQQSDISQGKIAIVEQGPSDVRELTSAFNDMRSRVSSLLEEKDLMLGAIGHDLRTPLAALRVRVESVEDEQERAQMVSGIAEMDQMLQDILSLARLGRSSETIQKVDVGELAQTIRDDYSDLGHEVDVKSSGRFIAQIRPMLMKRVLSNVIGNAVKYGKIARVDIEYIDQMLAIHVDDNGPGISEDNLAKMFEPFVRGERSRNRQTGGSGLGLTLARAITRDHGGDIVLTNRPEGGLRATIKIPRDA